MNKIIYLIMFLAMIGIVNAGVECQISDDNSTWTTVTSSLTAGCIDETNSLSYIQNLQASTQYYLRCDDTTDNSTTWGYKTITTNAGGMNEMELAIIWFLVALLAASLTVAFMVKNEYARYTMFVVSSIVVIFTMNVLANMGEAAGFSATVVALLWFLYKIFLYGFLFIVLLVLVLFMVGLKIQKNQPPMSNSPLANYKRKKAERKNEKYRF